MNVKDLVGLYLDVEVALNNFLDAQKKFEHFIDPAVFYNPVGSYEKRRSTLNDMRKIVEESESETVEEIINDLRNYSSRYEEYESEKWFVEKTIYDLGRVGIPDRKEDRKNDG